MNTSQQQSDESEKTERLASKRRRVFTLLQRTANVLGREVQPDEAEVWVGVLSPCSLQALEYAFEHISRNSKFWPRPADVLEVVDAFHQSAMHAEDWTTCGHCTEGWRRVYQGRTSRKYYDSGKKAFVNDPRGGNLVDRQLGAVLRCTCFRNDQMMATPFYDNYGQGYGTNDVKALLKLHEQRRRLNGDQPLSQAALSGLLDELNKLRSKM